MARQFSVGSFPLVVHSGCRQMKILVTGGAGFIGSALVRYLIRETEHVVVNVDKLTYAGNLDSIEAVTSSPRHFFEHVDICDAPALESVFERHLPDAVIHLAAESHVDRSLGEPEDFIQINIVGTFRLLAMSLKHYQSLEKSRQRQFRLLHVSTDEVFGDLGHTDGYFVEDSAYAPSSPYSASKAASDHLVRAWSRSYGLPVLITNCSNNYGAYQFPEKLIPLMILRAIEGQSLPVYGSGEQVRDWLYVDDHVKALMLVLERGVVGETYNIGGNEERTNLEVIHTLCHILEERSILPPPSVNSLLDLIEHVADRPGHDERYAVDASKLEKTLGWKPTESFSSGMEKTVEWYLSNSDWVDAVLDGSYRLHPIR